MKKNNIKNNYLLKIKNKIKRGEEVIVLAPMADVTDMVFREMIAKYSKKNKPDIFWTEFVSADGLASPGREVLKKDLVFNKKRERPIVAQIFGSKIENLLKAIDFVYDLGFNGVDINMGCPDKSIEKQDSGAALIKDSIKSQEILKAIKLKIENINKNSKKHFSFSVKTRLGYNDLNYQNWLPNILKFNPDILTIHLRSRKEMSLVKAHWELSSEVVSFIKKYTEENNFKTPLIFLNGDVRDKEDAREKIKISGAGGIMIGRGVFGTPWLFDEKKYEKRKSLEIETKEGRSNIKFRLKVLKEHTKKFEKRMLNIKSFNIMKKHYKAYVNGFDGAKELRNDLMMASNSKEVSEICQEFVKSKL